MLETAFIGELKNNNEPKASSVIPATICRSESSKNPVSGRVDVVEGMVVEVVVVVDVVVVDVVVVVTEGNVVVVVVVEEVGIVVGVVVVVVVVVEEVGIVVGVVVVVVVVVATTVLQQPQYGLLHPSQEPRVFLVPAGQLPLDSGSTTCSPTAQVGVQGNTQLPDSGVTHLTP